MRKLNQLVQVDASFHQLVVEFSWRQLMQVSWQLTASAAARKVLFRLTVELNSSALNLYSVHIISNDASCRVRANTAWSQPSVQSAGFLLPVFSSRPLGVSHQSSGKMVRREKKDRIRFRITFLLWLLHVCSLVSFAKSGKHISEFSWMFPCFTSVFLVFHETDEEVTALINTEATMIHNN